MAVQRFFPDLARARRTVWWACSVIAALPVACAAGFILATGHADITMVLFITPLFALAVWGLGRMRRDAAVIDIDLDQRTYAVVRDGKPEGSGPLDELGPLAVSMQARRVGSGSSGRTVVRYVVSTDKYKKLDLYVLTTATKARRRMETLARAWRLPCRSLGGAVREADALDQPLQQRLRDDHEATVAAPLRPEWGLRIEPVFRGQAIVSTYRSWTPLIEGGLLVAGALVVLALGGHDAVRIVYRGATDDPLDRVLLSLMGLVLVALLAKLAQGARNTFLPGAIHVTERGVSYRWKRIPFREIEEVTSGRFVEIVGDRRVLAIPPSFCPRDANDVLAREIQRLILEIAPNSPL